MKYAWIRNHKLEFPLYLMCRVLKIGSSSYHRWIRQGSAYARDTIFEELVQKEFCSSYCTYGTRRLKAALANNIGLVVSRAKIRKTMKLLGLSTKTKRRFKVITTDSNHNYAISPNRLQRDFSTHAPNSVFVGDMTYVPTAEGWLYLATVIDLFSRKIVGWAMDSSMPAALVNSAMSMAIKNRRPKAGLIWHTDRGSQYASDSHRHLLKQYGIIQSMSRKGDCWDNAVSESFFHTLKTELTHHIKFQTRREAQGEIFKFIEVFYNKKRLHSSNGYLSPDDYESKMAKILQEKIAV
jgi:putative transposase